jgi:dihydrofolate reductase
MAKLVFAMNVSLDGYVDHMEIGPPVPVVFRHFVQQVRGLTGFVYGRRMYEVMRYWEGDLSEWGATERDYAAAWCSQPKWIVSRTLKSVGPNATLIEGDVATAMRALKAQQPGEIQVGGTELAKNIFDLGLIDEYRLYFRPKVLGQGKRLFADARPTLRLTASEQIGDVMKLSYAPA